jgi:hypothetical protein
MKASDKVTPVACFRGAAVRYGLAIEAGSKTAATKAAGEGRAIRDCILASERGRVDFLRLLIDDDPWVRCAATTGMIDVDPIRALPVLNELQSCPGSIGAVAFTALRMWETKTPST